MTTFFVVAIWAKPKVLYAHFNFWAILWASGPGIEMESGPPTCLSLLSYLSSSAVSNLFIVISL